VRRRHSIEDWSLLVVLALMWGTAFLFTKIAVTEVSPVTVVVSRLALGAAIMQIVLRIAGLRLPPPGRIWINLLFLALLGNALPFFLITWGQRGIDSGLAGMLLATMPLVTLFLAHFFVDGEPMTKSNLSGFIVGLFGVAILMGPNALRELGGGGGTTIQQLAVMAGALCYAINAILARRLPEMHPLVTTAATLLLACAMVLSFAIGDLADAASRISPSSAAALLWLGVISTATATVVYFRIIATAGPTFLVLINYMIPVIAVSAGALVLGERPGWTAILALAVILSGIGLSQRGTKAATN
jgi:drug/metabolite transporter (DMT)-like permease